MKCNLVTPAEADAEAEEAGEKRRRKTPKVNSFLDRVKKKHLRGRELLRKWRGQ